MQGNQQNITGNVSGPVIGGNVGQIGDNSTSPVEGSSARWKETKQLVTVEVHAGVERWEKSKAISFMRSTPKIIGGVILGAFLILALLFVWIFVLGHGIKSTAAPIVLEFTVIPDEVEAGQDVELTWRVENLKSGKISGVEGALSPEGKQIITIRENTQFVLTAEGTDGSTVQKVLSVRVIKENIDLTATPEPQPEPVTPLPVSGLQTVRIRFTTQGSSVLSRGFFVRENYLVAFVSEGVESVSVAWSRSDGVHEYTNASVVRRHGTIAILKIDNFDAVIEPVTIRLSTSLQVGDSITRVASATDMTPGKVLEVNVSRAVCCDATGASITIPPLVTTRISFGGDAGAPVVDSEGRVVGVVHSSSVNESIIYPIEQIRALMQEIF